MIAAGKDYDAITPVGIARAMSAHYIENIKDSLWELPAGAFGESTGPS